MYVSSFFSSNGRETDGGGRDSRAERKREMDDGLEFESQVFRRDLNQAGTDLEGGLSGEGRKGARSRRPDERGSGRDFEGVLICVFLDAFWVSF